MSTTILIAEDETDLADVYTMWLSTEYEVRTAYDGEEALRQFDDDVDAVLLDRRMPKYSGDEVLEALRDYGHEEPVGMVTAVDPDFEIIEMGFNDYVVKPVTKEELLEFIDDLLALPDYANAVQRYYELASKKATLESSKTRDELTDSEEYQALVTELDTVRRAAQSATDGASAADLFSDL
jgi:two-component system response regulator AdeR